MKTTIAWLSGLCLLLASDLLAAGELTLDGLFPTNRVLDVQINVAEEDWDTIRFQTRNIVTALSEGRKLAPVPGPYTYVEASVTIDGVKFPRVGIRKKGFLGSQSATRPSLKIKLNYVDLEGGIDGLTNLTLNNNKQDVSLVSQFMGYALFNAAGSPASRCAFASVTVNGENLGIYSHVETARKPLLARGFGNDTGTLYEGTVVDFFEGWEGSFERKVGNDEAGRAKIKRLIESMDGGGGTVILGPETVGRATVPTSDEHDGIWIAPDFDDSGWAEGHGGAGYETDSGYESLISPEFDFRDQLYEKAGSIYMRFPFKVDDPGEIVELTLRMKYDDGFVAYINGQRVVAANAPEEPIWKSRATGPNSDQAAVTFRTFIISQHVGKLRKGINVLAIHGLNVEASSSDMLIAPELRWSESSSLDALAEAIDLDAFYKFWAIEGLLGFWDGYSGNRNNFFVYLNPENDKLHFLPWGADAMFEKYSQVNRDPRLPISVKTQGLVAFRLYQTPSGKDRYLKTLQEILDKHWDEEKLLAECDRIEAMLTPYLQDSRWQSRSSEGLERVRDFIRNRREEIGRETADGMPIWTKPPDVPPTIPAGAGPFGRRRGRGNGVEQPGDNPSDLWSAARKGDVQAIAEFLKSNVDVNAKDGFGKTALSWASDLGNIESVKFLIENSADVNVRNKDGTTPLDGTAKKMDPGSVDFFLRFLGINVDLQAVNAAKPRIAELLRKHGVDEDEQP